MMKGFGNIGRKKRQPVTRGIKNCRDSRLNQALCFYQSLCLVDSEVLRNRHLRVAAKRYQQE